MDETWIHHCTQRRDTESSDNPYGHKRALEMSKLRDLNYEVQI